MERSLRNHDQFHQEGSGPALPRRAEWRDGCVSGGSGDDFGHCALEGGFLPQAPGRRFGYDFGHSSFEPQRPCFEREFLHFGPEFSSSVFFTPPMSRWLGTGFLPLTPVSNHLLIHLTIDYCRIEA